MAAVMCLPFILLHMHTHVHVCAHTCLSLGWTGSYGVESVP